MPLTCCKAGAGCTGIKGVRRPAGSGQRLGRQMGTIVKFPDEGRIVRFGRADAAENPQPSSSCLSCALSDTMSRALNRVLIRRRRMAVADA